MAGERAKRDFLVVYDYGMGGRWSLLRARSEAEIEAKFSGLKVVGGRPAWMSDLDYARIAESGSFDIDAEPSAWLLALVRDRA